MNFYMVRNLNNNKRFFNDFKIHYDIKMSSGSSLILIVECVLFIVNLRSVQKLDIDDSVFLLFSDP